MKISRKKFVGISAAILGIFLLGNEAGYAKFVETQRLTFTDVEIEIPEWAGTKNAAKFVVASDFHIAPEDALRIKKIIRKMLEIEPDAFFLLGDFFKGENTAETASLNEIVELLSPLPQGAPTFAVLGNHDAFFNNRIVAEAFENARIRTFYPEGAEILATKNGAEIVVAGTLDADTFLPEKISLPKMPAGTAKLPKILLSHSPDIIQKLRLWNAFTLTLCGHTHGGQICLPKGKPIFTSTRRVGREFAYGLKNVPGGGGKIFTTRGLGTSTVPFRLFCPPEILTIKLVSPKNL